MSGRTLDDDMPENLTGGGSQYDSCRLFRLIFQKGGTMAIPDDITHYMVDRLFLRLPEIEHRAFIVHCHEAPHEVVASLTYARVDALLEGAGKSLRRTVCVEDFQVAAEQIVAHIRQRYVAS
ncbi:MAG: hypothetical protein Q7S01_00380 [bacterium]|nr:hypothetical protein [bacterium]